MRAVVPVFDQNAERPISGFAFLGLESGAELPAESEQSRLSVPSAVVDKAPLTRRELREAEGTARVAAALAPSPGPVEFPRRSSVARKRKPVRRPQRSAMRPVARPTAGVPKKSLRKRAASKLFSVGAMTFAGALMIGMSVPANAFISNTTASYDTAVLAAEKLPAQTFEVSATAVESAPVRDSFVVTSYAELLRQKYGNRSYSYSTTAGAIRWPFPYPVPITDGWGERVSPCRGCSSYHEGVDFTAGDGAPIYAIADGVVSYSEVSDSGYGNHVIIDHVVGGQKVQSLYAHMQMNSSPLTPGSVVKVGDFVGLVGSTGAVTGPHLHFELHLNGSPVDPFAWLQANAVN